MKNSINKFANLLTKFLLYISCILVVSSCKQHIPAELHPSSKLYAISTPKIDVTYGKAPDGTPLKLDLYLASKKLGGPKEYIQYDKEKRPTVIFIHGGGWVSGNKSTSIFDVLPYIEKGWQVVNVNYRLIGGNPLSIADCVEDVNKALSWVVQNADIYFFDTDKLIVAGDSAGGHLALMLGLANTSKTKIAGVVNWYGITDVEKCLETWESKNYTNDLIEDQINFKETCKKLSPVTYVSKNSPPVITIHGTNDQTVPYSQGVLLHEQLEKAGVPNQLFTLEGKKHGDFNAEDMSKIMEATFLFLEENIR